MMIQKFKYFFIFLILSFGFLPASFVFSQNADLLSPEEIFWLNSRNNTIIVYPEKNYPPFSYQSPGGNIQGLAIDYLELIAEKLEIKINYLSPQSRNQMISDLGLGKGDVATGFTESPNQNDSFIFTESYATVPTVIVVRKDATKKSDLNLTDFNGRRVSVVAGSALFYYIKENYPRVILEDVTDNEVSLQQIVLGEVDAGVMDVASLSYFLSRQVLSSVKIGGNTGFDYKLSFALLNDKPILQSILEKGLMQISIKERELFNEKWVTFPNQEKREDDFLSSIENNFDRISVYITLTLLLFVIFVLLIRQNRRNIFLRKARNMKALKEEVKELEEANELLAEELKEIQDNEHNLKDQINEFHK